MEYCGGDNLETLIKKKKLEEEKFTPYVFINFFFFTDFIIFYCIFTVGNFKNHA
jgi:hypothetical protein